MRDDRFRHFGCGATRCTSRRFTTVATLAAALAVVVLGCTSSRLARKNAPAPQIVADASVRALEQTVRDAMLEASLSGAGDAPEGEATRNDAPGEAQAFFLAQRLSETMSEYPVARVERLRRQLVDYQRGVAPGTGPAGILGWEDVGPGNIGGRTRSLVIDPNDPTILYAGGVTGGIWKSTDEGASWRVIDDTLPNLAIGCITMDPTDSSILYAGTGEGTFPSSSEYTGRGIYKSTDAGETWSVLPGTVSGVPPGAFAYVNKIRISPNDSNRLYAATRSGVWVSTDAGGTWSVALRNPRVLGGGGPATIGCAVGCTDLAIRPDSNPDQLFAAFGSFEADGLYRSDDAGATWLQYGVPVNQGRMTLAFAPSNPNVLYLLMADNGLGPQLGRIVSLFRSTDGGATFDSRPDPAHKFSPWLLSYASIALGCFEAEQIYSQGWHDNIVRVDPLDPDRVWVGGIDLYRSDDGGRTFGLSHYWFYSRIPETPPFQMHVDQHEVVFHPDYDGVTNQVMYVGNDGGIYRTDNARAATSQEECPVVRAREFDNAVAGPPPQLRWENLNNTYQVTQFYHGDVARDGTFRFIGGAQDQGTSRGDSTDPDAEWQEIFGGDGGYVQIDPQDRDTIYVETQFFPRIYKTVDGGTTWADANNGITDTDGLFITPFAMDPSQPTTLWTGGNRPWRTQNGAASWTAAGPNLPSAATISAIAVAPTSSDVVYLGFTNGYVARTTNGTSPSPTWQVFAGALPIGAWVSSIAVDPTDADIAYATYSTFGTAHVMRTTNGGLTWTRRDTGVPDIPAHWLAIRPCDTTQLYLGTELGVFASDDAGATWLPSGLGIPNTIVEALAFPDDDSLVAFTYGRSAHRTELAPCEAR